MNRIGLLACVLLLACRDVPLTMEPPEPPAAALTAATSACTRSWADSGGGAWDDPANWFPAGVPASTDFVCIDLPGTYDVTVDSAARAASLVIGGRGLVTVRVEDPPAVWYGPSLDVGDTLRIVAGSTLVFEGDDTQLTVGGALINDGTVRVVEGCGCALATSFQLFGPGSPQLVNRGLLDFSGNAVIRIHGGTFINEGDITVDFLPTTIYMHVADAPLRDVRFEMRGGTISGRHALEVSGIDWTAADQGERTFEWSGGTFEPTTSDSTRSTLDLAGFDIMLARRSLAGAIDVRSYPSGDTTRIRGNVPARVALRLLTYNAPHVFRFESPSGVTTNEGAVHVAQYWPTYFPVSISFNRFANEGLLTATQVEHVVFEGDSLVNRGTMLLATDAQLSARGTVLRNEGTLRTLAKPLRMGPATTFHAAAGSVMTGRLLLDGATLEGDGAVADVVAVNGTIRPGAPIGTLTAATVALDARSALAIDIAGTQPGSFDQLAVRGEVVYGGATLAVTEVAPFVSAQCGQVVPIVTDSATVPRGGFGKLVGLTPAFTRTWRMHNPANALQLVGHNPIVPITVQPDSVTATEGGAEGSYAICLGTAQPTADVVVNTARRGTQVEALPVSRTFDASNWMLPQFVRVIARNDADVEGPHSEIVDHTVTSADPYYASAFLRWVDVGIVDNDVVITAVRSRGRRQP